MAKYLIIHYNEIALKGKNKFFFENKLLENIRYFVGDHLENLGKEGGIFIGKLKESAEEKELEKKLLLIPGIALFMFATETNLEIETIKLKALEIAQNSKAKTFRITTSRHNKNFPYTSPELNAEIGAFVLEKTNKKVKIEQPKLTIFIEISYHQAYLYAKKINGIGGLPTNTAGTMVSLLSGGLDSPVASYLLMKRGAKIIFVHFQNNTAETCAVQNKIEKLVEKLTNVQGKSKLYIIPFGNIQQEIIKYTPSDLRMLVYRRLMLKIANQICDQEKAKALIVGDSLGQVASQTVENLTAVYQAVDKPIFSPLIGLNKEEIIAIARKLDTYETSILPYQDCCSFVIAKHPETKAKLGNILPFEKKISEEKLIKEAIEKAFIKIINPLF